MVLHVQGVSGVGRGAIRIQTRQDGGTRLYGAAHITSLAASCTNIQSDPKRGLARIGFEHLSGLRTSCSGDGSHGRKLSRSLSSTSTAVGVRASASRPQTQPQTLQSNLAADVSGLQWYRSPSSAGADVQVPFAEQNLICTASHLSLCGLVCNQLAACTWFSGCYTMNMIL